MSGWVAGAVAVSGYMGSQAAKKGAQEQAGATNRATDVSNAQYYQTREDQMPFLEAGKGALNKLIPLASNYKPFDYNAMTADPGYGFRLSEGQRSLDRAAAARGGLISGSALKAATRYGQDMGSQEYTNAFNRYQAERNAQLNPLQSLAGVGQTTSGNLGTLGAQNAANVGNLMTGGAAASAAGRMGQTQALTGGLGTYLNYSQGNNLVDALRRNQPQFQPGSNAFVGPMPQYNPTPDVTYGYGQN
jgi:hypothetical protein